MASLVVEKYPPAPTVLHPLSSFAEGNPHCTMYEQRLFNIIKTHRMAAASYFGKKFSEKLRFVDHLTTTILLNRFEWMDQEGRLRISAISDSVIVPDSPTKAL